MEVEDRGEGRTPPPPPPEGWKKAPDSGSDKPAKRKMKSPFQLEVLEKAYAVETYPSEAVRIELSAKIGLTDRQLQMWFCHRRLKDRKFNPPKRQKKDLDEDEDEPLQPPPAQLTVNEMMVAPTATGPSSSHFGVESRKAVARMRITGDTAGKRYYESPAMALPPPPPPPQLSQVDRRVIESVEAQLGEPLRHDGPILGIQFDPLPPGAFGAPIDMTLQQKQPVRPYDAKLFERHETKSIKASTFLPSMEHSFMPSSSSGKRKHSGAGSLVVHPHVGSRAPHEYQFLPQKLNIRSEAYERPPKSHFYDTPVVGANIRVTPLPSGHVLHGNEQIHLSRQQMYPSGSTEYDGAANTNPFTNTANDAEFGIHQVVGSENPYSSSDRIYNDEDSFRLERKRKLDQTEEARITKEVEAHEKKIRKELEKQDILRRKREEQMRKEMERHDRERRKEEERILREKQREEERFQREQRREIERREKFVQKESRRAEKLRQKEEVRREKEAARLKAANERATARRIARESMELIEDERLELLELAASSKGVSSMISLDSDTLQQLDLFRDMLSTFPPKSVGLKKPFAIQPWADSEENIGNLLMVWKFLITFADVLGLWPFTLDEFVQSLHDYDSRLLGEIHVALLRSIIKDIEDVARTPAISQGVNQNSAANPGGGHPQIVEGAYAWGFDICSWQRHLNPLTWSEILRQFALSAGLGPQLKKRNVEHAYFRDDNEGNDGEEVISNLRNGAAAENALALMQEKGYSHRRRSRHRLTPGTVKFAAFHILSLEGSKGLTILEVADKIQKSGLRDLTTSKTPEASIAAALSRDTKLFERTAPSTYCVRPAYRKNPADADTILSAAREKIQIFQSALSDSEEAEKDVEDADDVEKDDDSECDVADDPEVDDLATRTELTQDVPCSDELKDNRVSTSLIDKVGPAPQNGSRNGNESFSVLPSENPKKISVAVNCREPGNINMEDTEIDESNYGEPWVQGLTEGEYSDLSVEERLNALVSLIGVAIEGNSIRAILEERLEAATALKKQMWAEAQLDKRRWKEDYTGKPQYSSLMGYKAEATQTNNATAEGSPTALHITDIKVNDVNSHPINNDQSLDPLSHGNINDNMAQELSGSVNPDMVPAQQYGFAAEKSRSQLKSFIGHKAEELYVYRSLPLGQDRRRNRYWQFTTSASRNDAGSGRIFFESRDGFWRLIDSEEAFDALLAALDTRGIRESHLHSMLQRIETTFKETNRRQKKISNSNPNGLIKTGVPETSPSPDRSTEFDSPNSMICGLTPDTSYSSSFKIELGRNKIERNAALERYNGFLKWMWKGCYNPVILCAMKYGMSRCSELLRTCNFCYQCFFGEEKHCPSCHTTFKSFHIADANFQEHVLQCEERRKKTDPDGKIPLSDSSAPVGIQLLKAQLSVMEASIPAEALQSFWTEGYRKSWGVKLQASSSAEDLMQILTLLEGAIKKDFLSSNYETTNQLLSSSTCSGVVGNYAAASGSVPVLPWVPDTTQAVALRLLDLDASISYVKVDSQKDKVAGEFIKFPPRYSFVKNVQEYEPTGTPDHVDYQNERKWLDPGSSGRRGRGRGSRGGRVGRGRGRGRGSRGGHGSSIGAESRDGNYLIYEKTPRKYTKRGRGRGRGRKRGRRSIRPRQISESMEPVEKAAPHFSGFGNVGNPGSYIESSPRSSGDEWHIEENHGPLMEDDEHSAGFQSDENGQLQDYAGAYGASKPGSAMDDESEEDDEAADGDGDGDGDGDDEDVEADVEDEYDEMGDEDGVVGGIGENGDDEDEGASSAFSSEYSD